MIYRLATCVVMALAVVPSQSSAQDHTKMYVTSAGDTLWPGSRILITARPPIKSIKPYYPGMDESRRITLNSAKIYMLNDMLDQTYKITRLSRLPGDDGAYRELAVLSINSTAIQAGVTVDFLIDIEKALSLGEIKLLKTVKD